MGVGAPGRAFGNRFLFMKRWDYQALYRAVANLCNHFEADDWQALAGRIGRHIPWEFAS
jgi:hypothetical protein